MVITRETTKNVEKFTARYISIGRCSKLLSKNKNQNQIPKYQKRVVV